MIKSVITFTLLLFIASTGLLPAQFISGILVDEQSKAPLPYVNIGVLHREVGTVSDEQGRFRLRMDSVESGDSIRVSMLGYVPRAMTVSAFQRELELTGGNFSLAQGSISLKEATIRSRELVERKLGNFTDSEGVTAGFSSNDLGCELVIKIKAKRSPSYLETFRFHIARNIFDTLLFRVNVYDIVDGRPGQIINTKNIFCTSTAKSGWVSVDLRDFNIVAEGDFAIGLELIRDFRKGEVTKGLYFSAGFLNKNCYYRSASQQDWKKVPVVGLGFNVTVKD
ncbi:MAG: carboxypeptidase-like regulatory domain-containing protein [Bacteroidia bacterium]|nr:carboxypeptidase-like regulatory domain-containing protein [Bacteroidia bacterium]